MNVKRITWILLFLPIILNAFPDSDALSGDGMSDYRYGGTDRDLDNDGSTDYQFGGIDRDLDNDGITDHNYGGTDRDVDNIFSGK